MTAARPKPRKVAQGGLHGPSPVASATQPRDRRDRHLTTAEPLRICRGRPGWLPDGQCRTRRHSAPARLRPSRDRMVEFPGAARHPSWAQWIPVGLASRSPRHCPRPTSPACSKTRTRRPRAGRRAGHESGLARPASPTMPRRPPGSGPWSPSPERQAEARDTSMEGRRTPIIGIKFRRGNPFGDKRPGASPSVVPQADPLARHPPLGNRSVSLLAGLSGAMTPRNPPRSVQGSPKRSATVDAGSIHRAEPDKRGLACGDVFTRERP